MPYNVTPGHTAQAAKILGPGKILAVEQKVTIETDPAKARALGRKELSRYMVLPTTATTGCARASPKPILPMAAATSSSTPCACGATPTRSKGLRAHFDAGATHVCLQPVHDDGNSARATDMETLADSEGPDMDFGIALPTSADNWKVVRRAEELGFSHAWFYDTQMLSADCFVAMGAAAVTPSASGSGPVCWCRATASRR